MSDYVGKLKKDIAHMEDCVWPEKEVKVVGVAKPEDGLVIIAPVLAVSCAGSKLKKHMEYAESCYAGSEHGGESSELLGEAGVKQAPAAQIGIAMSSILFRFMLLLFCVKGNNPYDVKDYEWMLGYMESGEVALSVATKLRSVMKLVESEFKILEIFGHPLALDSGEVTKRLRRVPINILWKEPPADVLEQIKELREGVRHLFHELLAEVIFFDTTWQFLRKHASMPMSAKLNACLERRLEDTRGVLRSITEETSALEGRFRALLQSQRVRALEVDGTLMLPTLDDCKFCKSGVERLWL